MSLILTQNQQIRRKYTKAELVLPTKDLINNGTNRAIIVAEILKYKVNLLYNYVIDYAEIPDNDTKRLTEHIEAYQKLINEALELRSKLLGAKL